MKSPFFRVYIEDVIGQGATSKRQLVKASKTKKNKAPTVNKSGNIAEDSLEKKDITDRVERFVYEDAIEEDSFLHLTIKADYARELADDDDLQTGQILFFQFGFLGLEQSEVHQARITDLVTRYRERTTMDIKCLDLGTVIKKVTDNKIWENKTSVQIAQEIADKYALKLEADPTTKVWDNLPQANRNDMAFLKYIAKREETGNYITYVRNDTLYFVKRNTDKNSSRTFTVGDGESVVSFEPTIKESSLDPASQSTKVPSADNSKLGAIDNIINTLVGNKEEEKTGTMGTFKRVFNANGVQVGKTVVDPVKDKSEAGNLANSIKKGNNLKEYVAKLVTPGVPDLVPNSVITMKGVAKRHAGNWFAIKATHDISGSGYLTTFDLNRNGASRGDKAADANTSKGKETGKEKVTLRVFDKDGNYKGRTTDPEKRTVTGK